MIAVYDVAADPRCGMMRLAGNGINITKTVQLLPRNGCCTACDNQTSRRMVRVSMIHYLCR